MSFLPIFMKKYYPFLNIGQFQRAETFKKAIEWLEAQGLDSYLIIETGITRKFGNWADGQSTLIWDDFLQYHKGEGYSIDINKDYVAKANERLQIMKGIAGDSISVLATCMPKEIEKANLFYLDSFDLDIKNPMPSQIHHLMELTTIYKHRAQPSLLIVDDCISDGVGKHLLIRQFMEKIGNPPLFTGYQCGWVI